MSTNLDEAYLKWLYSQVASAHVRAKTRTYWGLLRQLYTTEFVWLVMNDENRAEDGRDLRIQFADELGYSLDPMWMDLGCSMLEMMLALSRRLSFTAEGEARDWFWHMIHNLGLEHYTDAYYEVDEERKHEVQTIIDRVIWRRYEIDGRGGLFPLLHPVQDQRNVEIWYQLCSYLLERD